MQNASPAPNVDNRSIEASEYLNTNHILRTSQARRRLGFDEWHDAVCAAFVPHESLVGSGEPFEGEVTPYGFGSLMLATVGGSQVRVSRTPGSIRAADRGYLKVGLQLSGYCVLSQGGREAALTPGDLAIYDTSRPYELVFEGGFNMLVLMLPRELVSIRSQQLRHVTARRISGRHGMGALLSPFLTGLASRLFTGDVRPSVEVCDAVLDLVAATCRSEIEAMPDFTSASARQALLVRIKFYIEVHLGDANLDTASLSRAHHVSPRYVQKLFQDEGETVRSWVRRRRLARCHRELCDDHLYGVPAAAIGSRWGFMDAANFTRAFRAEFQTTPSALRDRSKHVASIDTAAH
jgi:AraC-like DNA-binding protein